MSSDLDAREAIARAIAKRLDGYEVTPWSLTDAVLAALAAAGKEVVDVEREWGCRFHDGEVSECSEESEARSVAAFHWSRAVVRRRPAGEWEVAP